MLREVEEGTEKSVILGRYVERETLGEGASGRVVAGRHDRRGHEVAIKIADAGDPMARRRIGREMRALRAIHSAYVPGLLDAGHLDDGRPVLVMERLHGETLESWMHDQPGLPLPFVARVGMQLARAAAAAHEAGYVHRDIKPSNVLLHEREDGTRITKLIDFGICANLDPSASRITLDGRVVGTPEYMSPEQARGLPVGPASDVFTIGTVLYEMITGASAFGRGQKDPIGVARAVVRRTPLSIDVLRPDCPESLRLVVEHAMEKDPERRTARARHLARELEAVLAQEGWEDHPSLDKLPERRARADSGPVQIATVERAARDLEQALASISGWKAAPESEEIEIEILVDEDDEPALAG